MSDSRPVFPRALFRNLTTILATDLGEGVNLLDLTQTLILRNILRKLKKM